MISSTRNHGDFPSRRSSRREVFYRKGVLHNFERFTENTVARVFLLKLQVSNFNLNKVTLLRKTPALVFFCKFWNVLKSTSFVKQIRPAASAHSQNRKVSDTMI